MASARENDGSNLRRSDQLVKCCDTSLVLAGKEVPALLQIAGSEHAKAHALETRDPDLESVASGDARQGGHTNEVTRYYGWWQASRFHRPPARRTETRPKRSISRILFPYR